MMLDSGVLISIEQNDRMGVALVERAKQNRIALHTTATVVGQVWRSPRQALLAKFLNGVQVHPLTDAVARKVGLLLAASRTADVVDSHVVVAAQALGLDVLTGDTNDLGTLAASITGPAPTIRAWP